MNKRRRFKAKRRRAIVALRACVVSAYGAWAKVMPEHVCGDGRSHLTRA